MLIFVVEARKTRHNTGHHKHCTCGDADVDVGQCWHVASPGEESIAHLNRNRQKYIGKKSIQKAKFAAC